MLKFVPIWLGTKFRVHVSVGGVDTLAINRSWKYKITFLIDHFFKDNTFIRLLARKLKRGGKSTVQENEG